MICKDQIIIFEAHCGGGGTGWSPAWLPTVLARKRRQAPSGRGSGRCRKALNPQRTQFTRLADQQTNCFAGDCHFPLQQYT